MQCKIEANVTRCAETDKDDMLHLFALLLLSPPSEAKTLVTNTTLFEVHLHGNARELTEIKNTAFELASNGTAYKHGLRARQELIIGVDVGHVNLTRAQTDAIVDILYQTPVIVNETECEAYKHLPISACGASNHTDTDRLKEVVRGLQAGCKASWSALTSYAVERGIRACFDHNIPTNSSCAANTLGCLGELSSVNMSIATRIQNVLQQPALTKRSNLARDTSVVLYKRATPPQELDNARKTALWTGIVTVLGIVGALVTFVLGFPLGLPLGAMAIGFTVLGLLGAVSGASSQFSVYKELGKAQQDIQGRTDISNTTVSVPSKPGYCTAYSFFQSCQ